MLRQHTSSLKRICVLFLLGGEPLTLQDFFTEHPKTAVAFSGGVDSAYLLYAAGKYARETQAYYVKSEFQPRFELDDALRLAREIGAGITIIERSVLSVPRVSENPPDRCYYCKTAIFTAIADAAEKDGYPILLDGTNASDDSRDRPGMRALRELSVFSPLRECGLTKEDVRRLSKEAGLFTWDKPAYACLATRIPAGEKITPEKLRITELAENDLFSLGFTNFRIRWQNGQAKLQLPKSQLYLAIEKREAILNHLKKYYKSIVLDLEVRQ